MATDITRDRNEDAIWSWLSLREAGVIDPDAPWPFYGEPPKMRQDDD